MNFLENIENAFLPEIILFVFIIVNIVLSLFFAKNTYKFSRWFAILAIVSTISSIAYLQITPVYIFNHSFLSNPYSMFFKILILLTVFFIIFLSVNIIKNRRDKAFEYFTLLLVATLASMCLVSANDFITMFISLETIAVTSYFLTGYTKNYEAKEATLKYLIQGSIASSIILFGASYIYGITGSLNLDYISAFINSSNLTLIYTFSLLMFIFGLTFKIGCVPFQNWLPDIYEGTNYPTLAFLSLVPKIAAFSFLLKSMILLADISTLAQIVLVIIAVLSIFYGNIGAIRQKNIKRFFAYSSIAHGGFILLGFCSLYSYNISAVLFYLFCYIFMVLGTFAAIILFHKATNLNNIDDYKGLVYNRPYYVLAFCICLLSLAGLPLTSGFLSKIYLFLSITRAGFLFLPFLILAIIATVIGIFAYFKIIKVMFEKNDNIKLLPEKFNFIKFILYFCSLVTLLIGFFANPIIEFCMSIAYYI